MPPFVVRKRERKRGEEGTRCPENMNLASRMNVEFIETFQRSIP